MFFSYKDKQVNHTNENHSRELLETEDTHVYNNRGTYNEYDEHYCLLHHYPNCHYHQHDDTTQKSTCDNHEAPLNSSTDYNEEAHGPYEGNSYEIDLSVANHSAYAENAIKGANKLRVSKLKTGKPKRLILSKPGENPTWEGNEMCAHCHSPITSAYTRQVIESNGTLLAKDAIQLFEKNRDLVDDGDDQRGNI